VAGVAAAGVAAAVAAAAEPMEPPSGPSTFSGLPALGVGLGYRRPFRSGLFEHRDRVDFLEITIEHFLDPDEETSRELDLLRRHFPLIPHGLNLSLGTAEGLDPATLDRYAELVEKLRPPWWSEHIACTRAGGLEIGHLSPLPRSREAVAALCANIAKARRRIPVPLLLENITWEVDVPGAEMAEGEFIAEVLDRSGCGLLLDVTNLYANATNHGFDPRTWLDCIPPDRAVQLHFVGGRWEGGHYVDSHSAPAPEPVWDLMRDILARFPVKGVILERDEEIPPFGDLLPELDRARELGRAAGRWG
jgi:uncharacterized protein (UPF0276 family)